VTDPFVYSFEWDPQKAREDATKHDVSFELAATVFRDPMHVAVYDERQDYEDGRAARETMRREYDFSKGVRGERAQVPPPSFAADR